MPAFSTAKQTDSDATAAWGHVAAPLAAAAGSRAAFAGKSLRGKTHVGLAWRGGRLTGWAVPSLPCRRASLSR